MRLYHMYYYFGTVLLTFFWCQRSVLSLERAAMLVYWFLTVSMMSSMSRHRLLLSGSTTVSFWICDSSSLISCREQTVGGKFVCFMPSQSFVVLYSSGSHFFLTNPKAKCVHTITYIKGIDWLVSHCYNVCYLLLQSCKKEQNKWKNNE